MTKIEVGKRYKFELAKGDFYHLLNPFQDDYDCYNVIIARANFHQTSVRDIISNHNTFVATVREINLYIKEIDTKEYEILVDDIKIVYDD